jgi:chromosome segregation ATPase
VNSLLYIVGPTLAGALGSMVTLWVQKRRTRIELDAKKETLQIDEQGVPIKMLQDELGKRERELADLRAQDKAEREQYIETLTAMKGALQEIAADLKASREEQRQNATQMHQRLDVMDDRMLVIETRLGVKKP